MVYLAIHINIELDKRFKENPSSSSSALGNKSLGKLQPKHGRKRFNFKFFLAYFHRNLMKGKRNLSLLKVATG